MLELVLHNEIDTTFVNRELINEHDDATHMQLRLCERLLRSLESRRDAIVCYVVKPLLISLSGFFAPI
jgi:hypothetical protein